MDKLELEEILKQGALITEVKLVGIDTNKLKPNQAKLR